MVHLRFLIFACLLGGCTVQFGEEDLFRPSPLPDSSLDFINTDVMVGGERIGIRLNFPLSPHKDNRPVIFFLHGNVGNVGYWSQFTYRLSQSDARVIAIDYPGYGVSTGTPSLEGTRQSSLQLLDYLFEHQILTSSDTLVLYGVSLGSHPAIWLASDSNRVRKFGIDGLVIEAGLSNIEDMIAHTRSRIPLDFLIRDQVSNDVVINNDELIKTNSIQAFFIHGTKDTDIPAWMSEKLAAASGAEPYDIWYVEGAAHIEPIFQNEEEFDRRLSGYLDFL